MLNIISSICRIRVPHHAHEHGRETPRSMNPDPPLLEQALVGWSLLIPETLFFTEEGATFQIHLYAVGCHNLILVSYAACCMIAECCIMQLMLCMLGPNYGFLLSQFQEFLLLLADTRLEREGPRWQTSQASGLQKNINGGARIA